MYGSVVEDDVAVARSDTPSRAPPKAPVRPRSALHVRQGLSGTDAARPVGRRALALAAMDCATVAASVLLGLGATLALRAGLDLTPAHGSTTALQAMIVPLVVIPWCSLSWGHYLRVKPFWTETRELVKMILYTAAIAAVLTLALKINVSRSWLFGSLLLMMVLCPLGRLLVKRWLIRVRAWFVPLVIVGDRERVEACAAAFDSDPTLGYRTAARIEIDRSLVADPSLLHDELVAAIDTTTSALVAPRLLLAFDRHDGLEEQQSLVDCVRGRFQHVIVGRPMHGLSLANAEVLNIDKYDTLFVRMSPGGIASGARVVKRIIDVGLASLALLVLAPIFVLLALLVRSDGGPALYASERIGRGGRRFGCLKFRTMRVDADRALTDLLARDPVARAQWASSFKLDDDPRITSIGGLLRRTSLDELPQLWNVLRGDMSIVGPRPILPDELPAYGTRLAGYQGVRPGLTGLWQISGRNSLHYEERISLNLWYVRNWSMWLDFTIMLRTAPALLGSRDAS